MKMYTLLNTLMITLFLLFTMQGTVAEETVYGSQLMTEQERTEHRNTMRSFKTEQEREAYRVEHHKRMQERASEKGVSLPDSPQQRGKGMGRGDRSGQGMGGGGGRYR